VGITAGASTPDYLIEEVIARIRTYDELIPA
jgi:4-hydroxy-3-methylbut-2-enyl diphosphate reductase IspH